MHATDQGTLPEDSALHRFLAEEVLCMALGRCPPRPRFDAHALDRSGIVFAYRERDSGVQVVGKFYGRKWLDGQQTGQAARRAKLMQHEWYRLRQVRALGLDASPHRMVRPLAASVPLGALLVLDYAPGPDLQHFIRLAASGQREQLAAHLDEVVGFLAALHDASQTTLPVQAAWVGGYFDKLVGQLAAWGVVSPERAAGLRAWGQRWIASGLLDVGRAVLVHGDATPANFILSGSGGVTAIDAERVHEGDRLLDLGCLAAELKHLFFRYTGDPWASEPFIQQLYRTYARRQGAEPWSSLTLRGRFFMGSYLLRIARNSWLELAYRQQLVVEAEGCLAL